MREAVVILVSCAGRDEAARIGRALVERRLAACVHLRPHASIYRWQGQIEEANEVGLLIKTVASRAEAAMACVRALHSYELPAIIAVSAAADAETAMWLETETRPLEAGALEDGVPEMESLDDRAPEDGAPEDGAPEDGSREDGAP
jgi:periplasmic divalent cation tolerance protein